MKATLWIAVLALSVSGNGIAQQQETSVTAGDVKIEGPSPAPLDQKPHLPGRGSPEEAALRAALRDSLDPRIAAGPPASLATTATTATHFVPVVLSARGAQNSFYTSELTLGNRGTATVTLDLTYTGAFGDGNGTASDTLGPGEQKVVPDAISYLRSLGMALPDSGDRGGTLFVSFRNLTSPADGFVTVRTTTPVAEGRAGLAYTGIDTLGLPRPVFVPSSGTIPSGTFRATNYSLLDSFPSPAPTPSGDPSLALFNGADPNGSWSLYIVDSVSSDSGTLSGGWCLELVTTAQSWQGCNTTSITIPGSGTGASTGSPASLYPSPITVSGAAGTIKKAVVVLKGLSHSYLSDVDMLLVGPGGRQATVLSDAGTKATNITLRLDDVYTSLLVGALRQNAQDRSNVAAMNAGGPGDGDIVVRATVVSGDPSSPGKTTLPDETLAPGGFKQWSGILSNLGASTGFVRVEKVAGTAPLYAYGVVNDMGTSDGSFVVPVLEVQNIDVTAMTLPVVVESGIFSSELVVTNTTASSKTVSCTLVAETITATGNKATFSLTVKAGEQLVIPNLVQYLRDKNVTGIPAAGTAVAGALFASVSSGDFVGLLLGARTSAPGASGRYGLYNGAVPTSRAIDGKAWLYGLTQDEENRTNLALVNTSTYSTNVFKIELFDASTGLLAGTIENVSLGPQRWTQIGSVLSTGAPNVPHAYARITRTTGSGPFFAYAVLNDGAGPGQRSGDGAFVWGQPDCVYTIPSSRTLGWSGGATSLSMDAPYGCYWTAASDSPWIALSGNTTGDGDGTVLYTVSENAATSLRTGTLQLAGKTFTLTQLGNAPGPYDGSWSGTTSQTKPISFVVAKNEVTTFSLTLSAVVGQCSLNGSFTAENSPRPVVDAAAFSTSYAVGSSSGFASVGVNGKFNTANSASGSWNVSIIITSGGFCFGFPGASATWTATR